MVGQNVSSTIGTLCWNHWIFDHVVLMVLCACWCDQVGVIDLTGPSTDNTPVKTYDDVEVERRLARRDDDVDDNVDEHPRKRLKYEMSESSDSDSDHGSVPHWVTAGLQTQVRNVGGYP